MIESYSLLEQDLGNAPVLSVITNSLWIASLIMSLHTLLLAVMIKQWLVDYAWTTSSEDPTTPTLALRQMRREGIIKWWIPQIIEFLPIFLIFALVFFLVGLVTFFWPVNTPVAIVTTVFSSMPIICFVVTTALPSLYDSCMYRSGQAWVFYRFIGMLVQIFPKTCFRRRLRVPSWADFDLQQPSTAEYLANGLLWIHRSSATSDESLMRATYTSALSLDDPMVQVGLLVKLFSHDIRTHMAAVSSVNSEERWMSEYREAWLSRMGLQLTKQVYTALLTALPSIRDDKNICWGDLAKMLSTIWRLVTENVDSGGPITIQWQGQVLEGVEALVNLLEPGSDSNQDDDRCLIDRCLIVSDLVQCVTKIDIFYPERYDNIGAYETCSGIL